MPVVLSSPFHAPRVAAKRISNVLSSPSLACCECHAEQPVACLLQLQVAVMRIPDVSQAHPSACMLAEAIPDMLNSHSRGRCCGCRWP